MHKEGCVGCEGWPAVHRLQRAIILTRLKRPQAPSEDRCVCVGRVDLAREQTFPRRARAARLSESLQIEARFMPSSQSWEARPLCLPGFPRLWMGRVVYVSVNHRSLVPDPHANTGKVRPTRVSLFGVSLLASIEVKGTVDFTGGLSSFWFSFFFRKQASTTFPSPLTNKKKTFYFVVFYRKN